MNLDECRDNINACDKIIAETFSKRMEWVHHVAEYKKQNNIPILNAGREKAVLERISPFIAEPFRPYGERLFLQMMNLSKEYQSQFISKKDVVPTSDVIGFQGVQGSFSHEALEQYFGQDAKTQSFPLFEDLAHAVSEGQCHYGVIPIENSSAGSVSEVYDLLVKYQLSIIGEQVIAVRHCLCGMKGARIDQLTKIYSHPQALSQCVAFLKTLPHAEAYEATNTAASARIVAQNNIPTEAAIASRRAADLYGLEVLQADIHSTEGNRTRFAIISATAGTETSGKVSTAFTLQHKPGALFSVLKILEEANLNMTKLESRPIPERPWEYIFYLDFEAPSAPTTVINALKKECLSFFMLGIYQKREAL
ncbi:MAG: bifunctional chorismate mutase/prephenate dehydratase [Brevinema sp.]